MITADAPAACAFCDFSEALQVPRAISATAPSGKSAKSAAAHPSGSLGTASGAVIVAVGAGDQACSLELRAVIPLWVASVGSWSSGSAVGATLIAGAAVDGELTMNGRLA